ncbi:MAG: GNAT family N-acetyltransferase [Candidatus Paceibacterota bacterium]
MNFDQLATQKEGGKKLFQTIKKLSDFDTEGYDEYNSDDFNKYIKENNVDVPEILNEYLDSLNPSDRFSDKEIDYIHAFRSWLHCDFEKTKKYINEKLNFECNTNEEFIKKLMFFNTIAYFIFENENISHESEITKREKFIFDTLKEKTAENKGSFLLNYLSQDYISVVEKKKMSVEEEKDLEWTPFKTAPNIYAFDSSESMFALVNKNNLEPDSLYISNEKDFEKIDSIIKSFKTSKDLTQEYFDKLVKYFSPLNPENLILDSKSKKINETELYLFRQLNTKYNRTNIKEKTGIDLSKISLIEQRYFIDYLKFVDNNSLKEIINFNKKYKKDGFRTFLSIEHGGKEMGNKILELGKKLPEDVAKKVFTKYGEIVDSANKAEEKVKNLYEKENISNKIFELIKETLLKRGVSLLSNLADNIKENTIINEQEILNELEDIKTQTIIMGSSYVELYKQGIKIPIEDISNTSLEKISAQNLTEKEKQELLKVYENGRSKETYENKEHIKLLKDEFEQTLNNKDTFVFNIRFNNEIVAFATFNEENDDTLHIGGLTFIEDVRNPAIAVAVLNAVMDEFKDFNIKALVHSKNKILPMYQKRFGFKITGELPLSENAGELYYEIERPKNPQPIKKAA